jgi:hypothetical protein
MSTEPKTERSLPVQVAELWDLVRAYAKQETLEPIKGLGRWAALGIAGSLLLSIGLVELALAGLRALQTETDTMFTGSWSWAPYLITLLVGAVLMGLAVSRISQKKRKGAEP